MSIDECPGANERGDAIFQAPLGPEDSARHLPWSRPGLETVARERFKLKFSFKLSLINP
jgi:hypothetical protein